MNYILYSEDGDHLTELGKFESLEEGTKAFDAEVAEAKKNVEDYFGMLKLGLNEINPIIELAEWIVDEEDEDEGEFGEPILEWVTGGENN